MEQKRLALFQEIQNKKRDKGMFVDLTIYDVPASLLREFGEKIIRSPIHALYIEKHPVWSSNNAGTYKYSNQ